tara:strand:- start:187 stop:393 length:207 start_codon:yes stop_codon:yes gene_type:complete
METFYVILIFGVPLALAIWGGVWTFKKVKGEIWLKVILAILGGLAVIAVCVGVVFVGCLALLSGVSYR